MNNGIKGKEKDDKFFTAEFFGVTVIITAFLLLLCLFFGEKVLFEIGKEVQCFILGVFGYFAYPFLLTLFLVGFLVLFGKKPNPKKKGSLAFLIFLVFIAFSIMTILTNDPKPTDLSKYVTNAFESGRLGVNAVVSGGAMFSLIVFMPVKVLGNILTVIILSLITFFAIYFRLKYKKKHKGDAVEQPVQPQLVQPVQQPVQPNPQYAQPYQQPNVGYQQNPYGQDSNVYGAPLNGGYPHIFGGQPLNYGAQNSYNNQQNAYGYGQNSNQGYQNPNGYAQPNPQSNGYPTNPNTMSKEDAMRILYGNGNGMPKTYSSDFNDSFTGLGYKRADATSNTQPNASLGGSVSGEIPKTNLFDSYTYEDRSNEVQEETSDFNDFDFSNNNFEDDEDTKKARNFFSKIKEKYNNEETENAIQETAQETFEETFDDFDFTTEENTPVIEQPKAEVPKVEIPKVEKPKIETPKPTFDDVEDDEDQSLTVDNGLTEYGKRLIENMPVKYKYTPPPMSILKTVDNADSDYAFELFKSDVKTKILMTLETFGVKTQIAAVHRGPAVTRFDVEVPTNVNMSKITKLQDDINLRIAAKSAIRMIAPVPNTSYVGIEVPNQIQETVNLKEMINSTSFKESKPFTLNFALGKDVVGTPVCLDLADMPHLLISGTTGSGKSVCLNTMILSLLYKYSPQEVRFVIVDPKRVDLEPFKTIPHMMFGDIIEDVPTTNSMLTWAVEEMEERYKLLAKSHTKNIKDYNNKAKANGEKIMPRIVIIMDEFADIMLQDKRGVGDKVCALAQKARAAGIHLVLAAQRPSADIVEGPIKSNLPSRIVFRASSSIDSQVSLGEPGAEKLLGKGDCLYKTGGMFAVERVMGAYVSDDEMFSVIDFVTEHNDCYFDYNNWSKIQARVQSNQPQETTEFEGGGAGGATNANGMDPLAVSAMRMGYDYGGLSISSVQTKLAIGYPRAARIVNWLVDNGYVTPNSIAGKKQMILPKDEFEEKFGNND